MRTQREIEAMVVAEFGARGDALRAIAARGRILALIFRQDRAPTTCAPSSADSFAAAGSAATTESIVRLASIGLTPRFTSAETASSIGVAGRIDGPDRSARPRCAVGGWSTALAQLQLGDFVAQFAHHPFGDLGTDARHRVDLLNVAACRLRQPVLPARAPKGSPGRALDRRAAPSSAGRTRASRSRSENP